jgi:hypothetical protein
MISQVKGGGGISTNGAKTNAYRIEGRSGGVIMNTVMMNFRGSIKNVGKFLSVAA